MSTWALRLSWLPAVSAALSCDDGSCAAHLLQVNSQKVRRSPVAATQKLYDDESIAVASSRIPPSTEIKVIVAGISRSGTTSMECALMHFGFNPNRGDLTYRKVGSLVPPWLLWKEGGSFEPALHQLLSLGYNATSADLPTGIAYKELHEHFPKAKVINLVHPHGPDGWVKDATEYNFLGCSMWYTKYLMKCCDLSVPMTRQARQDMCREEYVDLHQEIVDTIPADQLLTYNVTQGWDPLAKFLGLPVPNVPFPHIHGAHIEMCYPDNPPELLYDDMVNAVDGLLSPEVWDHAGKLAKIAENKERLLTPNEIKIVAGYQAAVGYREEARQQIANASESE